MEICAGTKSAAGDCSVECHQIRPAEVGRQLTGTWASGTVPSKDAIPNDFKRMIACFTGQCPGDSYNGNSGDTSSNMWFWKCDGDSSCNTNSWGSVAGTPWGSDDGKIGGHTDSLGKVAWHTWGGGVTMRYRPDCEIGAWSSCPGGPNVFQIRYKPNPGIVCPRAPGYSYLFELEDDRSVDDVPDDISAIASGFYTHNAYYIGNDKLNELQFLTVEICAGTKSAAGDCSVECHQIRPAEVGRQLTGTWASGTVPSKDAIPNDFKRMIACFTGQCPGDSYNGNSGDTSSNMWFWKCDGDSSCNTNSWGSVAGTPWGSDDGKIGGHTDSLGKVAWHTWGGGVTMRYRPDCEIGAWSSCPGGPNVFQIRYQ